MKKIESINDKLFQDFEKYKVKELKKINGGEEAGTSIFTDSNISNETSESNDVHTRWSYDSTNRTEDTIQK